MLGIKSTFAELDKLAEIKNIRGCDTSQLAFMDKNDYQLTVFDNVHDYERSGKDIDLDRDICSNTNLIQLKLEERECLKKYGIL